MSDYVYGMISRDSACYLGGAPAVLGGWVAADMPTDPGGPHLVEGDEYRLVPGGYLACLPKMFAPHLIAEMSEAAALYLRGTTVDRHVLREFPRCWSDGTIVAEYRIMAGGGAEVARYLAPSADDAEAMYRQKKYDNDYWTTHAVEAC